METESRPWTQFENRCDSCGAESWVKFDRIVQINEVETNVQEFYFCGHHGRKYSKPLQAEGWESEDFSELIALCDPLFAPT